MSIYSFIFTFNKSQKVFSQEQKDVVQVYDMGCRYCANILS